MSFKVYILYRPAQKYSKSWNEQLQSELIWLVNKYPFLGSRIIIIKIVTTGLFILYG